jgi:hypothetical protein
MKANEFWAAQDSEGVTCVSKQKPYKQVTDATIGEFFWHFRDEDEPLCFCGRIKGVTKKNSPQKVRIEIIKDNGHRKKH